jgi:NTP pyrophosphatase (non-canonical NTP hydrolase)
MSKLNLDSKPALPEYQQYVADMLKERGFDKDTASQKFMLLMEECGELVKAARKFETIKSDPHSEQFDVAHEAADVFIMLLAICNHFGVDRETAFRAKEEINKKRTWK